MYALPMIFAVAVSSAPTSIDSILDGVYGQQSITAAPICVDATFLRRVSLDLIGRIPTKHELDVFLETPDRSAKIDQLLENPLFSRRFAEVWTASLVGYTRETPADREVLRQWLTTRLEKRTSYRDIAKALITADGQSATDGPLNFAVRHQEETGVQVCRQFLGVRLDCARCHDHPFARWTQQDFESMSRFFESVRFQELSEGNIRVSNRPMRAEVDERPRFLSGARPRTSQWRDELALFVTRSKPFARNFANRIWYHLMGRGIVDPPDDFNAENPPVSRDLLEFLADDARHHQFDVRHTMRLICNSKAYQRTSSGEQDARRLRVFAQRTIKPLTPEQLYDSEQVIVGDQDMSRRDTITQFYGETFDEDFLQTWKFRETVQTMLERVTRDVDRKMNVNSVNEAYRRVLSRPPTQRELELTREYPLRSVVLGLMQSNEFVFNH